MLESLIKQICCCRPDTPPSVAALQALSARGQRPDQATLEKVLAEALRGFSHVYVVVDALDECPNSDRSRRLLLKCLNTIHSKELKNLHMFWTSRKEQDILDSYNSITSPGIRKAIDLSVYRPAIDHDIGLYIQKKNPFIARVH